MKREWMIWSNEHAMWWGHNSCGYTQSVALAGRYSLAEAMEVCRRASRGRGVCWLNNMGDDAPNEVMVPSPEYLWREQILPLKELSR